MEGGDQAGCVPGRAWGLRTGRSACKQVEIFTAGKTHPAPHSPHPYYHLSENRR